MKVIVISLIKSKQRRKNATDTLKSHKIDFEFLDAIDGQHDQHPLLTRHNKREFLLNYGRQALAGEIGCYASHYLAWQKCVELNENLLILEDDFELSCGFSDALQHCSSLLNEYGFIRLEKTRKKPTMVIKQQQAFSLVKFIKVPQCLTCYAISPGAAKKLIQASQSFNCPVDVFTRNVAMHQQAIYGLQPYRCQSGKFSSEIGKRHRSAPKSMADRMAISQRKLANICFNFYEHLMQLIALKLELKSTLTQKIRLKVKLN